MGVVSELAVFAVDGNDEFEEEGGEVVENVFIFLCRGWWRSSKEKDGFG